MALFADRPELLCQELPDLVQDVFVRAFSERDAAAPGGQPAAAVPFA